MFTDFEKIRSSERKEPKAENQERNDKGLQNFRTPTQEDWQAAVKNHIKSTNTELPSLEISGGGGKPKEPSHQLNPEKVKDAQSPKKPWEADVGKGSVTDHLPKPGLNTAYNNRDKPQENDVLKSPQQREKEERESLRERLDDKIKGNMTNEEDKETAKELNRAIAENKPEAAARALERFKGNPKELDRFMKGYGGVLKDSNSGLQVYTTDEKTTFAGNNGSVTLDTRGGATAGNQSGPEYGKSPRDGWSDLHNQARRNSLYGANQPIRIPFDPSAMR